MRRIVTVCRSRSNAERYALGINGHRAFDAPPSPIHRILPAFSPPPDSSKQLRSYAFSSRTFPSVGNIVAATPAMVVLRSLISLSYSTSFG